MRARWWVRVRRQCSNWPANWSSWWTACNGVLMFMIASKSSGSFKDDCRLLKIEIHAGSSEAHDTLGWIYYKKKVYAQAISLLKESVATMAGDPIVRYHLGMAYYKNGNKDLARAELQQALRLQQDFSGAQ